MIWAATHRGCIVQSVYYGTDGTFEGEAVIYGLCGRALIVLRIAYTLSPFLLFGEPTCPDCLSEWTRRATSAMGDALIPKPV